MTGGERVNGSMFGSDVYPLFGAFDSGQKAPGVAEQRPS